MKKSKDRTSRTEGKAGGLADDLFLVQVADAQEGTSKKTLSFSRSPTVLLTFAANRFTRSAARVYQKRYGLGAMDWRMLVMLTREPGATAARSSEVIGIDKGAISRSLHRLLEKKLVKQGSLHANGRSREWRLTEKGHALHKEILSEALARQRKLFADFSEEEVKSLCDMLLRFLDNLEEI